MIPAGGETPEVVSRQRLARILAHAWDHSRFYRELYAARGIRRQDLPEVALEDLPVVNKADLMLRFDEAVTDSRLRLSDLEHWVEQDRNPLNLYLDEYIIITSSAGSRIDSYMPYTREAWRHMTAAAAPLLLPLNQGFDAPLRTAFFFKGNGHFAGATSASLASHSAHEVLRMSVVDPVEEIWARLNAFRPERIHSYASALTWLAEWSLEGKLNIAPRSVLATADRLTAAMRARIKTAWNADIYDLYAAAESLYMAGRGPADEQFRVFPDLNVLELVDSDGRMVRPGARGRMLVTSLLHTTLPLIRYELNDYCVLGSVGAGVETFTVDGKAYERLPVRLANGSVGALEVHELAQLEDLPGIDKLQFVFHSPVEIEIRYESGRDLGAQITAAFGRLLAQKSAAVQKLTVRRLERVLNSEQSSKLIRVVEPDQVLIEPVFLADDGWRSPGPRPVADFAAAPFIVDAGAIERRFAEMVARHFARPAALDEDRELTYGQLDELAARVAGELFGRGFDATRPVAVFCAQRFELLPLIFGVLRAGGCYLPLDPNLPLGRLRVILAETRPELLLTCADQEKQARALAGDATTILCLERISAPAKQAGHASGDDPACLLYTSGSTGEPKGVVLGRSTIAARAARYGTDYGLGPTDRIALLQSYAVSAGIREIFGALLAGATLAFYDVRNRGVAGLGQWLIENRVTILYAVPTLFRSFLETLGDETFPLVRVVRLGGEPAQAFDVEGFRRHFAPSCLLANGYAASETDTICQYFMDRDTRIVAERVAAGAPVAGVETTLRDERGDPVDGALGEVRVTGPMLAAGYWDPVNRRVLRFDLPFATGDLGHRLADGRIFLLGRRDLIVKIHGHRIHLGEIERALGAVPGIVESAAVARPAPHDDTTIVVYYVSSGGEGGPVALRRAVSAVVPPIPVTFVQLSALPRLPGGKVSRSNLPAQQLPAMTPPAEAPSYVSATEATVAAIWQDVLNVPPMARGDNFFDLGGDSIGVFRVLGQIKQRFGVDLTIRDFFAHPALTALAQAIDARRAR